MQVQSNKIKNNLQLDILLTLMEAPNYRLQSNQIMKTLRDKYIPKPYCDGAFDVAFSRAKKALVSERTYPFIEKIGATNKSSIISLKKAKKNMCEVTVIPLKQIIKNLEQLMSIFLSNPARLEEWFQTGEDIFYKETVGAARISLKLFLKIFVGLIPKSLEVWKFGDLFLILCLNYVNLGQV